MHLVGKCACFGLSLVTGCSYLGVPTLCTSTVHTPRTSYVWFDARSNIPMGAPRTHANQTAITTSTRTYVCVSRAWAYIPDGRFAACLLTIYTYIVVSFYDWSIRHLRIVSPCVSCSSSCRHGTVGFKAHLAPCQNVLYYVSQSLNSQARSGISGQLHQSKVIA